MGMTWQSVSSYKMLFFPVDWKVWNMDASQICMSSLSKHHANLFCIIPSLIHVLLKPTLCHAFWEEEAIDYSRVLNCWIVRSVKLWWLSLTWATNQNINSQNLGVDIGEIILLKKARVSSLPGLKSEFILPSLNWLWFSESKIWSMINNRTKKNDQNMCLS